MDEPPARFAESELPFVTIQLPIYNEQFVIDRLIEACCRIEYPRDRFEIQVLDDSTDETTRSRRRLCIGMRRASPGWSRSRLSICTGPTGTATRRARSIRDSKVARGEFVAIFDADFVPPPEWLMQVIHHFAEPEMGMVQTRWTHLNRDYSFLTQVEAILLDGHFVLEHGGRSRAGCSSTSMAPRGCGGASDW